MNNSLHKPAQLPRLKNKYFIIRHGESIANQEKIIVSYPENGLSRYGLTETGKSQALGSVATNKELHSDCIIVSSDFKRAWETAEIVAKALKTDSTIIAELRLRERKFGDFELTTTDNYKRVWEQDQLDPNHCAFSVESVTNVLDRVIDVLVSLEKIYCKREILLVSHGDILQILQTAFERMPVALHRQVKHLNTAELRQLILSN